MTQRTAPGRRAPRRDAPGRIVRAARREIWLDDANLFGVDASGWAPDPDEFDGLPGASADDRRSAPDGVRPDAADTQMRFAPPRFLRAMTKDRR